MTTADSVNNVRLRSEPAPLTAFTLGGGFLGWGWAFLLLISPSKSEPGWEVIVGTALFFSYFVGGIVASLVRTQKRREHFLFLSHLIPLFLVFPAGLWAVFLLCPVYLMGIPFWKMLGRSRAIYEA